MDPRGWGEIALTLAVTVALAWPLGIYMARVWQGERTWLDPVLKPVERLVYGACGVKPDKGQNWIAYAMSFLAFSVASFIVLYLILRFQNLLPLNPQGFPGLSPDLSFNTAISFVTNTNWQSYVPEQVVSTFSQMAGLTSHNFLSAAAGIAVAAALARAFAANRAENLGDFWVDLTRISLYVLLPFSLVLAVAFVALGEPQTLLAHVAAHTVEGGKQTIALFPVASQEAIKQFGTNGGGLFNANSAHPFENPNAITNLLEIVAMNVLGYACVVAFGRIVLARRDARALVVVMALFVFGAAAVVYATETQPAPALVAAHADASVNMEGKEVRFGAPSTAIWTAATTGASDGGVNAMHDSLMPLGGGVAMFMIQLGEIVPGGVGSGLYGMVVLALIAVFVAGLMVGRTPEYLGKKVEAREIKYAMLAVLILPLCILGFSGVAAVLPVALKGLANPGAHGLSEILYAYSSATGNNGSAFAGLSANTPWWNTTLGISMLLGRFAYAIPVLAIAGSMAAKPKLGATAGTFPTDGPLFIGLLIGVILIMGGLQFFPALALGPIVEHFQALHAVAAAR
ncbi:potassium-transporting ATPase subunit KdpA [Phenylobacterium hankyongense]|uniref:Potassium-transporting ATPase potassium-binding subunit n=1 Tax=Phenylobacterium hankyongense TaxID=1813876 RepID=A0A328B5A7_9CAUL|nr:potassium-transporting ATPase subunit KdpA [Phenylobacterium hankyongense]RAK60228.1 potassium-transporting ATPase subunit KdpA [Phenylobacterium hankyongense]